MKILAPGDLSTADLEQVESDLNRAAIGGVLVGAISSEADLGLRPLILDQGTLKVLRFCNPNAPLNHSAFFQSCYHSIAAVPELAAAIAVGLSGNQAWLLRPFYQLSLGEALRVNPASLNRRAIATHLIEILLACAGRNLVHGHLCPENICLENETPLIVDFAFHPAGAAGRRAAPELTAGGAATVSSDIYGLGLVWQLLFGPDLPEPLPELLPAMLHKDPAARPSLDRVAEVFGVQRILPTPSHHREHPRPLRQGRFLGAASRPALRPGIQSTGMPSLSAADEKTGQATMQWLNGTVALSSKIVAEIRRQVAQELSTKDTKGEALAQETEADSGTVPAPPDGSQAKVAPNKPRPKVRRKQRQKETKTPVPRNFLIAGFILLVLITSVTLYPYVVSYFEGYQADWLSADSDRMKRVAAAAVLRDDRAAQKVIVGSVEQGFTAAGVNSTFIKAAFNPYWAEELEQGDRRAALSMALGALLPEQKTVPLADLHAGVVLAVIGHLPLDRDLPAITELPLHVMFRLPLPYGPFFAVLEQLGLSDFQNPTARAAAQLLCGQQNSAVFQAFLREDDDVGAAVTKLKLLLLLPAELAVPVDDLWLFISRSDGILGQFSRWFDEEEQSPWTEVPRSTKLQLVAGDLPDQTAGLGLSAYADLLLFPLPQLRRAVGEFLQEEFLSEQAADTLKMLSSSDNQLTRSQTVALVMLLSLNPEQQKLLTADWYGAQPDPSTVIRLILARSHMTELDPISLEGARYLNRSAWQANLQLVEQLLTHPEPLVRALGYARLDALIPTHLKILEQALQVESNERLLAEIKWKLEHER